MYASITGGPSDGVVKSTNGGATWTSIMPAAGNTSIACSSDGTIVYVANLGQGLYKSTDSGANWSYVTSGAPLPGGGSNPEVNAGYTTYNAYNVACDATGTKVFMTTNFGAVIYRSIDGGVNWPYYYLIPGTTQSSSPIVLTSNIDSSIIYAAFNNSDKKIYKSLDNGVTWNAISSQGDVVGPFSSIASNLTGDFIFACSGNGTLNIFYETHAAKSVLVPQGGSLIIATACYNNGNNAITMENNAARTYSVTNLFPPGPIPGQAPISCFNRDTKILCFKGGKEFYTKVQDIRRGDLVKTLLNGYVKVNMIGTTKIYNSGDSLRGKNRLYICSPDSYPEITEDLIITGCHSILSDSISDVQRKTTIELLGRIMVTDKKYRIMAFLDDRTKPYVQEGVFDIYHIALDHEDYYMNYGIYANGLLVETCSKRFLKELSGMTLIN
jgi:photosystem II stability/assembly factor-like uncharacterized protein